MIDSAERKKQQYWQLVHKAGTGKCVLCIYEEDPYDHEVLWLTAAIDNTPESEVVLKAEIYGIQMFKVPKFNVKKAVQFKKDVVWL